MAKNGGSKVLDVIAIVIAVVSLFTTLYFQYIQGAHLELDLGQDVFFNSKPRVGLLCSIYNSGAKAGSLVSGSLRLESLTLTLEMISPEVESWAFTATGKSITTRQMSMSYVPAILIPPRSPQAVVLWFVSNKADAKLKAGVMQGHVSLSDGASNAPVVEETFKVELTDQDVAAIYAPKNEAIDIPVRRVMP